MTDKAFTSVFVTAPSESDLDPQSKAFNKSKIAAVVSTLAVLCVASVLISTFVDSGRSELSGDAAQFRRATLNAPTMQHLFANVDRASQLIAQLPNDLASEDDQPSADAEASGDDLFSTILAVGVNIHASLNAQPEVDPTLTNPSATTHVTLTTTSTIEFVWTFEDNDGSCIQTILNYPAIWTTRVGTCIDIGLDNPNCNPIKHGVSCNTKGYTESWDFTKDLPKVVQAMYSGVSGWRRP